MSRRVLMLLTVALVACEGATGPAGNGDTDDTGGTPPVTIRPRSNPIEYVSMTVRERLELSGPAFDEVVGPIFGGAASNGLHDGYELQSGLTLSVYEDERTGEQLIVNADMTTSADPTDRRTLLQVPVSVAYGGVYLDTVHAAIGRTGDEIAGGGVMDAWNLDYWAVSANGGRFAIRTAYTPGAPDLELSFTLETPRTSLKAGEINTPAFIGDPYEQIGGTVNFTLTKDQFSFFSHRAYGVTAGAQQNFEDFLLQPHNWLRLTVHPKVAEGLVVVEFEVVTLDEQRVFLAKAPASFQAGEQFQQNVFRLLDNMYAQEALEPGSSASWTAPFHYDDPEGGGVVKVIAQGTGGVFSIAYTVESPLSFLRDVDYVPYLEELDLPDAVEPAKSCRELGSEDAEEGRFNVIFAASSTVRESDDLTDPLRGNVWGSIFRDEDVTVAGPIDGAESVADFHFEDVDVTDPLDSTSYLIDTVLPAGHYQLLGFMDIDANAVASDPDVGDPVMIPIGAYEMACAEQPVIAEFALLLPKEY